MSELGNKLRDARIEKGYTLNTLQQMTKIQKKYLQAIEEGQLDQMPGAFYTRAFIKQYADMVGLDSEELLIELEEEIDLNSELPEAMVQSTTDTLPSRTERYLQKERNNLDILLSYVPLVLLIAIIFAIIISLIIAINNINRMNQPAPQVEETNEIVSVIEPDEATESLTTQRVEETTIATSENDIRVGAQTITLISNSDEETTYRLNAPFDQYKFEFKGHNFVWIGAFEDGEITLDSTVTEGETFEYKVSEGTRRLRLQLGYPEGADILVNGTKVESKNEYMKETIVFELGVPETESTPETEELTIPSEEEGQ